MYTAAQQHYIAKSKYLEYCREEDCLVMFKNIRCILKMTTWHAIHSKISFNLDFIFKFNEDANTYYKGFLPNTSNLT